MKRKNLSKQEEKEIRRQRREMKRLEKQKRRELREKRRRIKQLIQEELERAKHANWPREYCEKCGMVLCCKHVWEDFIKRVKN